MKHPGFFGKPADFAALTLGDLTVRVALLKICPEEAAKCLKERNTDNFRDVSRRHVDKLVKEMPRWHVNGAAVSFFSDGVLVDGQKRLQACVESGIPFTTLVVVGVEADGKLSIDTSQARTFDQYLTHLQVSVGGTNHETF